MAFVIRPQWVSNTAYTSGTVVNFNGVDYEATVDITSSVDPSQDGTSWEVRAVTKVQDYNSLVEAVRLQLNVRDLPEINDSIPLFIQMTEESFKTRIRAPQQRKTVTVPIMDGRILAPGDMLEVINLRVASDRSNIYGGFARESIEILNGNYEEFQEVRQYFSSQSTSYLRINNYESPVYWFDNRYFNIAPDYDDGTMIELVYFATIPQLGEVVSITNDAGEPLNSAGQTVAEWIAAGNTEASFVQDMQTVTRNWFTAVAPQMLLYGSCLRAKPYLRNDDDRVQLWAEFYAQAEQETQQLISRFEDSQPHTIQISNGYLT